MTFITNIFSAYFEDDLHSGGHYQSVVPVQNNQILRDFTETGGVDIAAMMFPRDLAATEMSGDLTSFDPEQNSTRYPDSTPAPVTLEETCVTDFTIGSDIRKRVRSPESPMLQPIKLRRLGDNWDIELSQAASLCSPASSVSRSATLCSPPARSS